MAKSIAARNRTSRAKGRQGEFAVRELLAKYYNVHPDSVLLRSKSANGCDVIFANSERSLFPFSVEVKNRRSIPYFEVVRQMLANVEGNTLPLAFILNEKEQHTCIITAEVLIPMIKMLNDAVPDWLEQIQEEREVFQYCMPKIKDARANFR